MVADVPSGPSWTPPSTIRIKRNGSDTWLLKLREEHGLRVFENKVLKRIFGPKRDEIKGVWRKLHNEHHKLYSSSNIIRMKPRMMR
jgi:hypothetical protein